MMLRQKHTLDMKLLQDLSQEEEEPLGSVTQVECSSPGSCAIPVRSSARVSKKLRLDSMTKMSATLTSTSPDKKESVKEEIDKKVDSKEPRKMKSHNWAPQGKDIFFEALNEFGKDFEAIQRYFVLKSKKKGGCFEHVVKSREQIRHFYYRTWAKISKHLRFPPDIKKQTQELYGLINYGEFRKKMGCVTEKTSLKLNELVIRGYTVVRIKGKSIQIRTPRCRTLRRLNQLEDCQDELKLPSRIHVELIPKYNDTWARVQATSQNPRVQLVVPLQYRLTNMLQFLQSRWLPRYSKYKNKLIGQQQTADTGQEVKEYLMVAPKPNADIHISEVNLCQLLTSTRICLNSHEERLGRRGVCEEILKSLLAESRGKGKRHKELLKEEKKADKAAAAELKKAEESARIAGDIKLTIKNLLDDPEVIKMDSSGMLSPGLSNEDKADFPAVPLLVPKEEKSEVTADEVKPAENGIKTDKDPDFLEGLIQAQNKDEAIAKIRRGWSLENSESVSVGDIYLMVGNDYKLQLDYWWKPVDEPTLATKVQKLGSMLSRLVRLTKLTRTQCRIQCPCGHQCPEEVRRGRRPGGSDLGLDKSLDGTKEQQGMFRGDVFRKPSPHLPKRLSQSTNRLDPEAFKAQLDKLTPRYCNRRGRGIAPKNVLVQRTLPLLPKSTYGHAIVALQLVPQSSSLAGEFVPVQIMTSAPGSPNSTSPPPPRKPQTIAPKPEDPPKPSPSLPPTESPAVSVSPTPSLTTLLGMNPAEQDPMLDTAPADGFSGLSGSFSLSADVVSTAPPSPSPTVILREEDWLNSECPDYSLSSILGHLEGPVKSYETPAEVEAQLQCLMTESSIDYMAKFADLAAKLSSDNSQ